MQDEKLYSKKEISSMLAAGMCIARATLDWAQHTDTEISSNRIRLFSEAVFKIPEAADIISSCKDFENIALSIAFAFFEALSLNAQESARAQETIH